jgi:hypothetical protein
MSSTIAGAAGITSSVQSLRGGNAQSAQNRARAQAAVAGITGGMGLGEAASSGLAGMANTTATFNNNRDSNNINASGGSGSQVSQAELNTPRDNNGGAGVLTAAMHQMNSPTPIVGGSKQGIAARQDLGYSSNVSSFSPTELETGGAMFGSDIQRQQIMNPQPVGNIDQTGMNSLYGGPLSNDMGPKSFMGINPDHKGYCTPMDKPTCTPRRKALAKRLKPGGDLYKSKK